MKPYNFVQWKNFFFLFIPPVLKSTLLKNFWIWVPVRTYLFCPKSLNSLIYLFILYNWFFKNSIHKIHSRIIKINQNFQGLLFLNGLFWFGMQESEGIDIRDLNYKGFFLLLLIFFVLILPVTHYSSFTFEHLVLISCKLLSDEYKLLLYYRFVTYTA